MLGTEQVLIKYEPVLVRRMLLCPALISSSSVETRSPLQCIHSVWVARIRTVVHYFELLSSKPVPEWPTTAVPCSLSSQCPGCPRGFSLHPLSPGHIPAHASLQSVHPKLHFSLRGESGQRGVTVLNIIAVLRRLAGGEHTVALLTRGSKSAEAQVLPGRS